MRRVLKPFINSTNSRNDDDQQKQEQSPSAPKGSAFVAVLSTPKQKQRMGKLLLSFLFFVAAIYIIFQRAVQGHIHRIPVKNEENFNSSKMPIGGSTAATIDYPPQGHSKCDQYRGILHIQHGDREGAAGSIFFLFIMNQLIYADKYQLLPWIHLNDISQYVFDEKVHGERNKDLGDSSTSSRERRFQVWHGAQVSWSKYFDTQVNKTFPYPGPPVQLDPAQLQLQNLSISGNGVWESYFRQPLYQDFFMPLLDCPDLPVLSMTFDQVIPALHAFCPWSVRAWKYGGTPPSLQPKHNETTWQWLEPQRKRAHEMVTKYYHFQPTLLQRIDDVWWNTTRSLPSSKNRPIDYNNCLGMHVRHSDKANLRKRIPTDRFKAYVEAYRNAGGTCVYLATDSNMVVSRIRKNWPSVLSRMIATPSLVVRSSNKTAVFVLGSNNHHRTNTEVLVDIVALSKCRFLLHGYSAVSEASIYLNLQLHYQSVNLDDRNHPTAIEFENTVRRVLWQQQEKQRQAS